MVPTLSKKCHSGVCVVSPGDGYCGNGDECKCLDGDSICGHVFPSGCNKAIDILYLCTGGAGSEPIPGPDCGTDKCLVKIGNDECTAKPVDPCACVDGARHCGSIFPDSCGYDKDKLYKCPGGVGTKPTGGDKCNSGACIVHNGDDACKPPPPVDCKCHDAKEVCGSVWQADCKYERDTLYTCAAKGTDPIKTETCDLGCFVHLKLDDECKAPNPCLCQGKHDSCGSEFPEECGFSNNTLYSCTGKDATPAFSQMCKGDCELVPGTSDRCIIAPIFDAPVSLAPVFIETCGCADSTSVCGSAFDTSCGLADNTLYTCTGKDAAPAFSEMCKGGCELVPGTSGRCIIAPVVTNTCDCVDGADVCGSAFGRDCAYERNYLYKCPGGKGTPPVQPEMCTYGKCLFEPGGDVCQGPPPTDCKCNDDLLTCGSLFNVNCSLSRDTVYSCLGGSGSDPKPSEICTQGCFIHAVGNDECKKPPPVDPCKCRSNKTTCGFTFPNCGYKPNTLHLCTDGKGSTPIPDEDCPLLCLEEPGPDMCQAPPPTDCLCHDDLDICGKTFPASCHFPNETLFVCPGGANSQPVVKTDCPDGCTIRGAVSNECKLPEDCKCKNTLSSCGDAFPPSCNRAKNTLYHCPGGLGTDPEDSELCTYGSCIIQPTRNDICQPKPPPDCNCPANSPVCGSVFLPECKKESETLYTCEAQGSPPVATENCTLGCHIIDQAADKCKIPDCTCTESGRFCGSKLKPNCNFEPNTIYDCTKGSGTDPVPQEICLPGTLCLPLSPNPSCGGTDCKCTGTQTICSNMFPESCGLQKNSLYKCTPSGKPILQNTCDSGKSCVQVSDGGSCGDCKCPSTGVVCGSAFPKSCLFYSWSLYTCTQGETPVPGKKCFPNHCISTLATFSATSVGLAATSMASSDIFKATADDICVGDCKCSASGKVSIRVSFHFVCFVFALVFILPPSICCRRMTDLGVFCTSI